MTSTPTETTNGGKDVAITMSMWQRILKWMMLLAGLVHISLVTSTPNAEHCIRTLVSIGFIW